VYFASVDPYPVVILFRIGKQCGPGSLTRKFSFALWNKHSEPQEDI
jgi:hypothetical protein